MKRLVRSLASGLLEESKAPQKIEPWESKLWWDRGDSAESGCAREKKPCLMGRQGQPEEPGTA